MSLSPRARDLPAATRLTSVNYKAEFTPDTIRSARRGKRDKAKPIRPHHTAAPHHHPEWAKNDAQAPPLTHAKQRRSAAARQKPDQPNNLTARGATHKQNRIKWEPTLRVKKTWNNENFRRLWGLTELFPAREAEGTKFYNKPIN